MSQGGWRIVLAAGWARAWRTEGGNAGEIGCERVSSVLSFLTSCEGDGSREGGELIAGEIPT
jgi:hypothetical protein